jgi:hypothetical protein
MPSSLLYLSLLVFLLVESQVGSLPILAGMSLLYLLWGSLVHYYLTEFLFALS